MAEQIPIPTLDFERDLLQQGFRVIAGVDEAGRGSLFGPVCVGMAVLPLDDLDTLAETLTEVRDSKKLYRPKVYRLADVVKETALAWAVGVGAAREVDQFGIMGAIRLAAERTLSELQASLDDEVEVDFLLTDTAMPLDNLEVGRQSIVKGDAKCLSIACAAILAKHRHDVLVRELAQDYDESYQLNSNVGYGTAAHIRAIRTLGPTPHHRYSYKPVAQLHLPLEDA